jgi:hypothetical protein
LFFSRNDITQYNVHFILPLKRLNSQKFSKLEFEFELSQNESYKILQKPTQTSDKFEFVFLNETLSMPEVNLCYLEFEALKSAEKVSIKPRAIKFEHILQTRSNRLIETVCLTSKNAWMILYYECELYVIDIKSCEVLVRDSISNHQMTMNFFLSPTYVNPTNLTRMVSIDSTDSAIALNNLNHLVFISFNPEENKLFITDIINERGESVRADSFKINLSVLICYNKLENRLLVVDLKSLLSSRKLKINSKNIIYEMKIAKESILGGYGLSEDNVYAFLIENTKLLRFHNLKTRREIASMPLYCETTCLLCNRNFICMSMQDNKVISFLINDPSRADSYERIKSLPSRADTEPNKKKAEACLILGDSVMFKNEFRTDKEFYLTVFNSEKSTNPEDSEEFNLLKKSKKIYSYYFFVFILQIQI